MEFTSNPPVSVRGFAATMAGIGSRITEGRAARIALDLYGIAGEARALTGERDENFHLVAVDGRQFVLKISHPAEEPDIAALSTAAMLHIERTDPALPSPRVAPNLAGHHISTIRDAAGADRSVRLVSWIAGIRLHETTSSPRQRAACGDLCARLGQALADFRHPAARRALIWDIAQFDTFVDVLREARLPCLDQGVEAFLDGFQRLVGPQLPALRRQVVHNDMNSKNVIAACHDHARINGVIDFGDVVETYLACDLAVTIANCIGEGASVRDDALDVARAYHRVRALTPAEVRLLGPLVAMRVVMGLLIPAWYRVSNPTSEHYAGLRHSAGQRMALARALSSDAFADHIESRL